MLDLVTALKPISSKGSQISIHDTFQYHQTYIWYLTSTSLVWSGLLFDFVTTKLQRFGWICPPYIIRVKCTGGGGLIPYYLRSAGHCTQFNSHNCDYFCDCLLCAYYIIIINVHFFILLLECYGCFAGTYIAFHKLPQIRSSNHATFPIQMYAITV